MASEREEKVKQLVSRLPWGVAQWETQIVASLPRQLEGALPTVEQIEAELGGGS